MQNKLCKKNAVKLLFLMLCLALIIVGLMVFKSYEGVRNLQSIDTSIINLISTPKAFNKKSVRVIGVFEFEFEGYGLYLSINDYEYAISKNAVWLDIDENLLQKNKDELKAMSGKYVVIEGNFRSDDNGHFDSYSGTIENIKRIDICRSRTEILEDIGNGQ